MSEPYGVEKPDDELRAPFQAWLAEKWKTDRPDVSGIELGEFELPKSGFSAKTIFVPVTYQRSGQRIDDKIVLRIESPEPAVYPQQSPDLDVEIDIQYRSMELLEKTGKVPLAKPLGYEADPSILGQPFFVMDFAAGEVMTEDPPYVEEGIFADASPEDR